MNGDGVAGAALVKAMLVGHHINRARGMSLLKV
jgi:hypothetical protein